MKKVKSLNGMKTFLIWENNEMKTRYKVFAVIGSFVTFFFAGIPMVLLCHDSENDCTSLGDLVNLTRPVIYVGDVEWSVTPKGVEEEIPVTDYINMNIPFIFTMIVLPCAIIGGIVVWDKRR